MTQLRRTICIHIRPRHDERVRPTAQVADSRAVAWRYGTGWCVALHDMTLHYIIARRGSTARAGASRATPSHQSFFIPRLVVRNNDDNNNSNNTIITPHSKRQNCAPLASSSRPSNHEPNIHRTFIEYPPNILRRTSNTGSGSTSRRRCRGPPCSTARVRGIMCFCFFTHDRSVGDVACVYIVGGR